MAKDLVYNLRLALDSNDKSKVEGWMRDITAGKVVTLNLKANLPKKEVDNYIKETKSKFQLLRSDISNVFKKIKLGEINTAVAREDLKKLESHIKRTTKLTEQQKIDLRVEVKDSIQKIDNMVEAIRRAEVASKAVGTASSTAKVSDEAEEGADAFNELAKSISNVYKQFRVGDVTLSQALDSLMAIDDELKAMKTGEEASILDEQQILDASNLLKTAEQGVNRLANSLTNSKKEAVSAFSDQINFLRLLGRQGNLTTDEFVAGYRELETAINSANVTEKQRVDLLNKLISAQGQYRSAFKGAGTEKVTKEVDETAIAFKQLDTTISNVYKRFRVGDITLAQAVDSLNELDQELRSIRSSSDLELVDRQRLLDSTNLLQDVKERIDRLASSATDSGQEVSRAFETQIRSIRLMARQGRVSTDQFIDDYKALEQAISSSNIEDEKKVQLLLKLASAQGKYREALEETTASVDGANKGLQQTAQDGGDANYAMVSLSRLIEDMPFGLIGFGNNIQPVIFGFRALNTELNRTQPNLVGFRRNMALMKLALASPINQLILLQSIITAIGTAFAMGAFGGKKTKDELRSLSDEFANLFDVQNRFANTDMSRLSRNMEVVNAIVSSLETRYKALGSAIASSQIATGGGMMATATMLLQRFDMLSLLNKDLGINEEIRKSLEKQSAEIQAQAIFFKAINEDQEIRSAIQNMILNDLREETDREIQIQKVRDKGYQHEVAGRNRMLILTRQQEREDALVYEWTKKGLDADRARVEARRRLKGETEALLNSLEDATKLSQEEFRIRISVETQQALEEFTGTGLGMSITRSLSDEISEAYKELKKLDERFLEEYGQERAQEIRKKYVWTFQKALKDANAELANLQVGEFGMMKFFSDEVEFFDNRTQELILALRNRTSVLEEQQNNAYEMERIRLSGQHKELAKLEKKHLEELARIREESQMKEQAILLKGAKSKRAIQQMEMMSSAQMILGGLEQLNQATEAKNRKDFENQKRLSLGLSFMNTALAVTMALADPKETSMLKKFATASTAFLTGIAQYRAIKSTQYGSEAELSAGALTQGITFSDAGATTPQPTAEATSGSGRIGARRDSGPQVNINVSNNLDRKGLYTLVQEGYDELSTSAIATT